MNKLIAILIFSSFLFSCGEEILTQNTQTTSFSANDLQTFELNTCSQMHFEKPPVDILFVVDNSGSTLVQSFQQIKSQIANTVPTLSPDFDYHVYVAPLMPTPGDSISQYPIVAADQSSFQTSALNFVQLNQLEMFQGISGNNAEYGFQRAIDLVNSNRSNGIFRNNSNLVIVMISNGDDNQSIITIQGNQVYNSSVFNNIKNQLLSFSEKYAQSNFVSNPMNAESLRFISLVAHSNCNSGWKRGSQYISMSTDIYNYMGYTDDNSSTKDSVDLCSGNFSSLFSSINESIKALVVGHKYDHWKISSATEAQIQDDDITVTKILSDGQQVNVSSGSQNGFEYLGYKTNQNTRYAVMKDTNNDGIPEEISDPGEPQTGLMIKLNGSARLEYPECVIAKTRTPTEYFGYIAIPREPQVSTISVTKNGQDFPQNTTNGWSYIGWRDVLNIKVPGPSNASVTPALNKSGYFIQLHGDAILTNGDDIKVYYKPAAL